MLKLFKLINGWKSVLSYLLISVPGITDYPMLVDAINKVLAEPSRQNILNFAVQLLLAGSIFHRVIKNLKLAS